MTNAGQSWALPGILGATATGSLALVARSQASLKAFTGAELDAVDARFAAIDGTFEA